MTATADIVIIGGGIVGASIAYHLTEAGCSRVLILEREPLQGWGSTGRATGGFRTQFTQPLDIQMSLYSLEMIRAFKEITGVDSGYRPNGYVFLATDEAQRTGLEQAIAAQRAAGLSQVKLIGARDVQSLVPGLFTQDVVSASFCPLDGFIEPLNLMNGFTRRALERGARLQLDTEVIGFDVRNGVVQGVQTTRGAIASRCVVNATGAWAGRVAALAGIELPVTPLRRQVAATQPLAQLADGAPMVVELASSFHFRKDHSGGGGAMLLWNDPAESPGEDVAFDARWLHAMLPLARRRLPLLADAQLSPRRCWAGLYEMTPDRHPILGRAPEVEGLYFANGFSGHGVMHSPATGKLLSELILDGAASLFDVAPLRLARFAESELLTDDGVL